MKRLEYGFKPVSTCSLLIVILLCLAPMHALALDPEFGRIVPDVQGMTVEHATAVLEKMGLGIEVAGRIRSMTSTGTIIRQSPGKGAETTIGTKVNVWVAQRSRPTRPDQPPQPPTPDPLHAEIHPPTREVQQGEPALFESRSTPREGIRETWTGPGNQQGTGASFEIGTEGLEPGSYGVGLMVTNQREQRVRARAVLVVTAKSVPPVQPGGSGDAGTVEPQPEYSARIDSDTQEARQSQPVAFTTELIPGRRDARFRFHFGDGTSEETRTGHATHVYEKTGTFEAFVEVLDRRGGGIIESNHISIEVIGGTASPGDGGHHPDYTWLWIGTALLGGIGAGYLLFARRKETVDTGAGPAPCFRAVPRSDAGTQYIDGDPSRMLGPEIGFVAVADSGMQEITTGQEPIIREERWEND